jgi:bifunctional polynucleotide phosphatase/kinase
MLSDGPQEYFLGLPPAPYTLPGFHVSSLPMPDPVLTPSTALATLSLATPTVEAPATEDPPAAAPAPPAPELVLFVGPPAIGKTTHFTKHLAPLGYAHVNQDTLGSRPKCLAAARAALAGGTSAVVDNTNRDAGTRALYVRLARELGVRVRCVLFAGGVDLARHNNLYRAYVAPPPPDGTPRRAALPELALSTFRAGFEAPALEEGFAALEEVQFVFEGSEEERRRWGMWLSVDK